MMSESELMYERQKLFSLMQQYPEWSLRAYARVLHHDLKWVRTWAARFKALVTPTLDMFRSQSRRPNRSPNKLPETLKATICALRQPLSERFNRPAGAETIQYFLKGVVDAIPCGKSIYKALRERGHVQARGKKKRRPLDLP